LQCLQTEIEPIVEPNQEEKMKGKNRVFGRCEKCIGITPCKVLRDGRVVCEYCANDVIHFDFKPVVKTAKDPICEQMLET
jgi:hypothetical protein